MNVSDPAITLEGDALAKALELQEKESIKTLRLYIEGKGCDGFYYGVCFDARDDKDLVFSYQQNGRLLELIVDPDSLRFLSGAKILWVDDERGQGFLVDNPEHTKYRGKFFRRKSFQFSAPT